MLFHKDPPWDLSSQEEDPHENQATLTPDFRLQIASLHTCEEKNKTTTNVLFVSHQVRGIYLYLSRLIHTGYMYEIHYNSDFNQ